MSQSSDDTSPLVNRTAGGDYGRLTYTSFDSGGVGGWQVKQLQDLSPDEVDQLRAWITTQFDAAFELPLFPSPGDIEQFPRRMLYAPAGPKSRACWHTVPAGVDGSGRPGNVFVDVILERLSEAQFADSRPIDLWHSSDWLTPFGADSVRAAQFDPRSRVRPGPEITKDLVIEFVLDFTNFRLGILSALLDACAQSMQGGPGVVLATETADRAAKWIGAVSHLMPASYARSFYFSTLERASSVDECFKHGLHLVCVPTAAAPFVPREPNLVLLDETEDVSIGDLSGQPHITTTGTTISATEWSVMAQVILADPLSARLAMDLMDETAIQVVAESLEPGLGLAMAVSRSLDQFRDAAHESALVIARASYPGVTPDDLPTITQGQADEQNDLSTQTAWRALTAAVSDAGTRGSLSEVLLERYAKSATQDLSWLGTPGGVPVPAGARTIGQAAALDLTAEVRQTLQLVSRATGLEGPSSGNVIAALANFIVCVNALSAGVADELIRALDRWFVDSLFDSIGSERIRLLGPFDEHTQSRLIRPLAEQASAMYLRPAGERLQIDVLTWLLPECDAPTPLAVLGGSLDGYRMHAERSTALALAGRGDSRYRPLAVWAHLESFERRLPPTVSIDTYFSGEIWEASDISSIERRFPGRVPLRLFGRTLKGAPAGGPVQALCELLAKTRAMEFKSTTVKLRLENLIKLRASEHLPLCRKNFPLKPNLAAHLRAGVAGIEYADVPFDSITSDQLKVAFILGAVLGRHSKELGVLEPTVVDGCEVSERVRIATTEGLNMCASVHQVAFAAIVGDAKFPQPNFVDRALRGLAQMMVNLDGVSVPLLRHYLEQRISEDRLEVRVLYSQLARRLDDLIPRDFGDSRSAKAVEHFAVSWLNALEGFPPLRLGPMPEPGR